MIGYVLLKPYSSWPIFMRDPSVLPRGIEGVESLVEILLALAAQFSRHNLFYTNAPKSCFLEEGKNQGRGKCMESQEGMMNGNKESCREQRGVKGKAGY